MCKKITAIAIIITVLVALLGCFGGNSLTIGEDYELIRIHIRANSNSEDDQAVKLLVRDAVVKYLSSELSDVTTRAEAFSGIEGRKTKIERLCNQVLMSNGFSYEGRARLTSEYFPTRMYEQVTVESGYYDALIIELGEGEGDNWWCVIYPPLCYLEAEYGSGFRYKSKLKELIDKYFGD